MLLETLLYTITLKQCFFVNTPFLTDLNAYIYMDKQMKIQLTQTPFASKQKTNILDKTKAKDLDTQLFIHTSILGHTKLKTMVLSYS